MLRRRILIIGGLALVGVLTLSGMYWRSASAAERRGGWRLALQSWTYNSLTLFEAVDKAKEAGLRFIEVFPGQRISKEINVGFSPDAPLSALAQVKIKLEKAGVRLTSYGVEGIGKDEAKARKLFDFAKMMGIGIIVAEPEKDAFDLLDKLTEEYMISIAIHNHPKPSTYWSPDVVLEAVKGHSKRIGSCADIGHWMRSGIDPLEAVKKLEGRIISSHFKDGENGQDVVWGTGKGNAKAILAELNRQGFRGVFSIEYEAPMKGGEVKACADYFNEVARELNVGR
jgi:sugar phosphate isomerase/epimerase